MYKRKHANCPVENTFDKFTHPKRVFHSRKVKYAIFPGFAVFDILKQAWLTNVALY